MNIWNVNRNISSFDRIKPKPFVSHFESIRYNTILWSFTVELQSNECFHFDSGWKKKLLLRSYFICFCLSLPFSSQHFIPLQAFTATIKQIKSFSFSLSISEFYLLPRSALRFASLFRLLLLHVHVCITLLRTIFHPFLCAMRLRGAFDYDRSKSILN